MFVCLSIASLRLKYMVLGIVYIPVWHVPLKMLSRWRSRSRTQRIEDARMTPDVWKTVNCSTKGLKTTRQETTCASALELFTSLADLCNRIGGGQHSVILTALQDSPFQTFHMLRVRHMMCMRIPS